MAERLSKQLARYRQTASNWHGRRERAHNELKAGTTSDVWNGLLRRFDLLEEEGPTNPAIPPEEKGVHRRSMDILAEIAGVLVPYVNSLISRDNGNMVAKADIIVDGETIAPDVPAVALIALEADFRDLLTLVREIPEAPAGDNWTYDPQSRLLISEQSPTLRTAQRMKSMITAAETERHPAQVHVWSEAVPVATILQTRYHGGILPEQKRALVTATEAVFLGIQNAREEANAAYETEQLTGIGEQLVRLALPGIAD